MTKANTGCYSNRQAKRVRTKATKKENRKKKRKILRKDKTVTPPKEKQTHIANSAGGIKLPKLPGGKPGGRGSVYRKLKAIGKMRGHKAPRKPKKSKRSWG
jgi:hypothetical protein